MSTSLVPAFRPVVALAAVIVASLLAPPSLAGAGGRASGPAARAASRSESAARPLATRQAANHRRLATLQRAKARAERKATRQVGRWSDRRLAREGWRPEQRDQAAGERARQLFGRTERRQLVTAEIVETLLVRQAQAATPAERDALAGQADELSRAADLNRKLGTERQLPKVIKRALQLRFPRLAQRLPFLRRATQHAPGTPARGVDRSGDPVDSTMWKPRKAERVTPEALHAGPWKKPGQRPTLPAADSVLALEGFRSLDADGIHPSVFVSDPATGESWKVKFLGPGERADFSAEPIAARLLYAMGYATQPVYHVPALRLDPRALIAAFRHKNRIGVRIKEGNRLGLAPGKYGRSPYDLGPQIDSVTMADGRVVRGAAGVRIVRAARRHPDRLDAIRFVTLRPVDLALKGGKDESIGPFDPDAPAHVDQREMRALSIISATWMGGNDLRFNNLRLDAEPGDDGGVTLEHKVSDPGAHFGNGALTGFGWTVDLDVRGQRLHSDGNRITLAAYDRTTLADARWAARRIGALSEEQILASVAAGARSYPAARLLGEKLIARRDDLVTKLGLAGELGLLRPAGADRALTVRGAGKLRIRDAKGQLAWLALPAGDADAVSGQLVPRATR